MRPSSRTALLCALWIVVTSTTALAAQYLVSQDGSGTHTTIQGALTAAGYGDVVFVTPGIYEEGISFKNGVTLVGSGAGSTTIRYGYGFDPVVHVRHASAGRIEGFRIERTGATLPAPAVLLESASITVADCTITGAQQSGVEIVDSTSSPTIEDSIIRGNGEHGIWAHDGARIRVVGCQVLENAGSGLLLTDTAVVEASGTELANNDADGIALTNGATASLVDCDLRGGSAWGVRLSGTARLDLEDCVLDGHELGALLVTENASASLTGCVLSEGGAGIEARDASSLRVETTTIRETSAAGIAVDGTAGGILYRVEVDRCGSDGVRLASEAACSVDHATVVRNELSGILIRGSDVSVSNTIVAYNGRHGIRSERLTGDPGTLVLSHNNVWGNGELDYAGMARRTTDLSSPPEFANLLAGDLTLRQESPCIDRGSLGTTIGAHPNPAVRSAALVEITPMLRDVLFGFDVSGLIRLEPASLALEVAEAGAEYEDDCVSFSIRSSFAGQLGKRTVGSAHFAPSPWSLPSALLSASMDLAGVLDGVESWLDAAASVKIAGSWFSLSARCSRRWPSSTWYHDIDLSLGTALRLQLFARTADLRPESLIVAIERAISRDGRAFVGDASIALGGTSTATLSGIWTDDARSVSVHMSATLDDFEHATASLRIDERPADVSLTIKVKLAELTLADGSIAVTKRLPSAGITAELGMNGDGLARCALRISFDFGMWATRTPNLLPHPEFIALPPEIQAGEPVTLDASASADPDGEIVEYWWDFGDGTADLGPTVVHVFSTPGMHEITLTIADDDGAIAVLVGSLVVWEANSAPVAAFVWEPVSDVGTRLPRPPRTGDILRLDASESYDPGGLELEYHWDLNSDGAFEIMTRESIVVVDSMDAGSRPVTLRVINSEARADAVMHAIAIGEPKPPEANFDMTPTTPSILDPVRFTDTSVDVDGHVVAWEWDFGDGRSSRDTEVIHRYEAPGVYTVSLTVGDDDGLDDTRRRTLEIARVPQITAVNDVWVLAIGISDYESVTDLLYARDDATAIARWALDEGIPPDRIRLLTDGEDTELGPEGPETKRATLVNVREALGWLRRAARADDLVMIFFSGHGYQGQDDGSDERDGVDEFFVLVDSVDGAVDDTALRDDEFGRFLDRLVSNHVLVFFDGCYSGGLSRSLPSGQRPIGEAPDIFKDFSLEGRLVLSASGETEEAFESPALGHGVFTHFVLEGLRGSADLNGDRHITAWELYEFLLAEVPAFVRRERGANQTPHIVGEGDVRVLVAAQPLAVVAAFSYGPTVPFAGGPTVFRDETIEPHDISQWTFGDGATSSRPTPVHVYEEPGEYSVTLSVIGSSGVLSEATHTVTVASSGRIIEENQALWVVSLGRRNGIEIGDQLTVLRGEELKPLATLQVIELLEGNAAVCQAIGAHQDLAPGDLVRSLPESGLP